MAQWSSHHHLLVVVVSLPTLFKDVASRLLRLSILIWKNVVDGIPRCSLQCAARVLSFCDSSLGHLAEKKGLKHGFHMLAAISSLATSDAVSTAHQPSLWCPTVPPPTTAHSPNPIFRDLPRILHLDIMSFSPCLLVCRNCDIRPHVCPFLHRRQRLKVRSAHITFFSCDLNTSKGGHVGPQKLSPGN